MSDARSNLLLRYCRRLLGTAEKSATSDGELLARFVSQRDEAAFELLLWRHGTMVRNVCRAVLGEEHAAEDAFQATFFALIRQAHAIRKHACLGAWLYQVAYRAALRARAQRSRRAAREQHDLDLAQLAGAASDHDDAGDRELRALVHEEIQHLPAKYRLPIVLCYLEGLTHEEAGRRLNWPRGTVAGQLARARELLRKRLTRRGVALSAALAAISFSAGTASAVVPAALVQATLRTGLLLVTGKALAQAVSRPVAVLTEGVLQTMFWNKVLITAAVVLALALAGGGMLLFAGGQPDHDSSEGGADRPTAGDAPKAPADSKELAAARAQSLRNLKAIVLAMHNWESTYGTFPPPAIYGKDGKPLLSWRVAILPYLDQDTLYKQFHLDEPWDSPHNRKLLTSMPRVYAIPGKKEVDKTFYQVFVGESTIFEGTPAGGGGGPSPGAGGGPAGIGGPAAGGGPPSAGAAGPGGATGEPRRGMRLVDITDGTSNTLLVVEGGTAVPWTKPVDLAYAPTGALPALGGAFPDVIHAAFADGSVMALKRKLDEKLLRAAITRNGGEVIDRDDLIDPAPGADPVQLQQENDDLRRKINAARNELRQLQAQLQDQAFDPFGNKEGNVLDRLKQERRRLERELETTLDEAQKLRAQLERLKHGEPTRENKKLGP